MPLHDSQRQSIGRYGAHVSWANTVDRTARTRKARSSSPSAVEWHLARLPEQFDDANYNDRLKAAESAQRAYFAKLAMKSAAARRGGGDAA